MPLLLNIIIGTVYSRDPDQTAPEGVMAKCLKILYVKVSDKVHRANSADPDQTTPELFAVPLSIGGNNLIKSKIMAKKKKKKKMR